MAENNATTIDAESLLDGVQESAIVLSGLAEMLNACEGTITSDTTMSLSVIVRKISSRLFDIHYELTSKK